MTLHVLDPVRPDAVGLGSIVKRWENVALRLGLSEPARSLGASLLRAELDPEARNRRGGGIIRAARHLYKICSPPDSRCIEMMLFARERAKRRALPARLRLDNPRLHCVKCWASAARGASPDQPTTQAGALWTGYSRHWRRSI